MRVIAIALLAMLTLSACGEGSSFDQGFKKSFREKFVESCAGSAKRSAPAGASTQIDTVCACAADKIMADRSATELMRYQPGETDKAKVAQCVAELRIKPVA